MVKMGIVVGAPQSLSTCVASGARWNQGRGKKALEGTGEHVLASFKVFRRGLRYTSIRAALGAIGSGKWGHSLTCDSVTYTSGDFTGQPSPTRTRPGYAVRGNAILVMLPRLRAVPGQPCLTVNNNGRLCCVGARMSNRVTFCMSTHGVRFFSQCRVAKCQGRGIGTLFEDDAGIGCNSGAGCVLTV